MLPRSTLPEWAGVLLIAGGLLVALALVQLARRHFALSAEISRKLMHVTLGLGALCYPLLFHSVWPPFVLAALTMGVLVALRLAPRGSGAGGVVHGVTRRSEGDLYFPLAAAAVFALARGNLVLFAVPIATLTLADSVAALVGTRYGQMRYETVDEQEVKSAEGSIAFFLVAFFSAHVPLLLLSTIGRAEALLLAATFAFLVMLLEAVAWRGLDNLFIPIGGMLLLRRYMPMNANGLATALIVTVSMFILVLSLRRRRTLSDGAMLLVVLLAYAAWTVGGWRWVVPPLALFVSYTILWPRAEQLRTRPHRVAAVLAVPAAALMWLIASRALHRVDLFFPYTLTIAANLAFIGVTWFRVRRPAVGAVRSVMVASLAAWSTEFGPYLLADPQGGDTLFRVTCALPLLILGAAAYTVFVPKPTASDDRPHPWLRQAVTGLATAGLGLLCIR